MKTKWPQIVALALALILPVSGQLYGNDQRSIVASGSVSELRPEGQTRIWTFTHRGEEIGKLVTRVVGTERINERQATVISDSLFIDYSRIGAGTTVSLWGKQYVSSVGTYLGSDLSLPGEDRVEELSLRLVSDPDRKVIKGYFTREGRKLNRSLTISRDMFGWDIHLLDQLELWLSMQSFSVGDTLQDTLFSPQTMVATPVRGVVDKFMYRELFKGTFDSVFVIELEQPQEMQLTFAPRKELVRVDFKPQKIRAYLDYVGFPKSKVTDRPNNSGGLTLGTILRWLVLSIMGLVTILLLASPGKRSMETWLGLVIGGAISGLLLLLVTPLQSWLADSLLSGASNDAGKIYWLWLVPSAVIALTQEGFKAVGIYLTALWRNPKEYLFTSIGAALGVGFGLIETGYQTQAFLVDSILDWPLLGHLSTILFHGVTGSLVGWAILRGSRAILRVVGLAMFVNILIHYLPSFVVNGLFEPQLVHLATALISVIFLLAGLLIQRRAD